MKVAFDLSLMHLDTEFSYLSFPQITEHPPKKRVNVDTKDQGDKLFENIKYFSECSLLDGFGGISWKNELV